MNEPSCLNAPLLNTHPNRLKLALQVERARGSKMKTENKKNLKRGI